MSADNWAICPKCKMSNDGERESLVKKIKDSYANVSFEQYEENVRRLHEYDLQNKNPNCTLREDYEQGIDEDGIYEVRYGCSCNKCGFEFIFTHKVNAMEVK